MECSQRRGPWAKEVHFFNRWPLSHTAKMDYISCFPASTWKLPMVTESPKYALVDATPDYMFNSMAAPRIKAMWPAAKFVVLLRVCTRNPCTCGGSSERHSHKLPFASIRAVLRINLLVHHRMLCLQVMRHAGVTASHVLDMLIAAAC